MFAGGSGSTAVCRPAGAGAQARPHGRELGAPGQGDLGTCSWRSGDRQDRPCRSRRPAPSRSSRRRSQAAMSHLRGAGQPRLGRRAGPARPRGRPEGGGQGRPRRPAALVRPVLAAASPAAGSAVLGEPWISSMPQARSCSIRRAPVRRRPAPFPRSPERPLWIAPAAEKSARRHSVSCFRNACSPDGAHG